MMNKMNMIELNTVELAMVTGGTGPLKYETGPLGYPYKETGPLNETGPLDYPYKKTGSLTYPY